MSDEAPNTLKNPRVSAKVRQALDALIMGHEATITGAAERAGITREYLSRQVNRPEVAQYLDHRLKQNLALGRTRAAAVKIELLDCDNAMVRDRASSWFLGAGGGETAIGGDRPTPGVVIQIVAPPQASPMINVTPQQPIAPDPIDEAEKAG